MSIKHQNQEGSNISKPLNIHLLTLMKRTPKTVKIEENPLLSSNGEDDSKNPKSLYKNKCKERGELILTISKPKEEKELGLDGLGAYLAKNYG